MPAPPARMLADVALTGHDAAAAELDRALAEMEQWKARSDEARLLAFGCARCGASAGFPCVGRRTPHAPRVDRMIAAMNSAPVQAWRADLEHGDSPRDVLRTVKRSRLYRLLYP